jgi:hypothetical protein
MNFANMQGQGMGGYGGGDYYMGTYLCSCHKCEHVWERKFMASSNSYYECPNCKHFTQHESYRVAD